jgi:hypothetical protein
MVMMYLIKIDGMIADYTSCMQSSALFFAIPLNLSETRVPTVF